MKKLTVLFNVLTVALVAGSLVMSYFAQRKLGLVRWLNFHSQNIRAAVNIDIVKLVILALVIAVAAVMVWRILRAHKRDARKVACMVFAIVVILAYAFVALFVTHEVTKADVFIIIMSGIAALLQMLNLIILSADASRT